MQLVNLLSGLHYYCLLGDCAVTLRHCYELLSFENYCKGSIASKVRSSWNFLHLQTSSAIPFLTSSGTSAFHQQNETQLPASYSPSQRRSSTVTSASRMSAFYSSPVSPSSDPGTYVSILRNIKRKAINAGARPQDFDAYLRHILLIVNGPLYRGYTESTKHGTSIYSRGSISVS